jgi:DNA-binding transcriptional MocR family regulator
MVARSRLALWLQPGLGDGRRAAHVTAALRGLILDGRLVPGTRLPAERELATDLRISRSTVTAGYDRLRAEGFLVSRVGAGTFVDLPARAGSRPDGGDDAHDGSLDLTVAALPAPALLADAAAAAVARLGAHLPGTGLHPSGLATLRAAVADRYSARGVATVPDQVIITSGALHGWDLLLRALTRPGGRVMVEQPTYPGVVDAALAHHVRISPLPVEPEGWDLSQLPAHPAVGLTHVTLDGQNPTGLWADRPLRRRLLGTFAATTVIAVDETMMDFCFTEVSPPASLASVRTGATVVRLGSTSKSFWAGLRIGWVRGPVDLVRRLAAARSGQDLAPPVLDQLLAVELLAREAAILPGRVALAAERRAALLAAVAAHCPDWSLNPPAGGLALWVDLGGRSSTQLALAARERGVRITPGPRFTLHGSHDRYLRLPFVLPPGQADDVVRRLAEAATDLEPASHRRRQTADTAWTA